MDTDLSAYGCMPYHGKHPNLWMSGALPNKSASTDEWGNKQVRLPENYQYAGTQ
jgi:hypothetical protein